VRGDRRERILVGLLIVATAVYVGATLWSWIG
jgi:hypothetical protein